MAITVNTNISSLVAQNSLNKATGSMNKAMERLTTGLKINRAADDAAGLSIVSGFTTQIRGSKVAQNNIQQGVNMLQTAEGYIASTQENVNRIRDLAVQAANDTYSPAARTAIADEITQLVAEINQVSSQAEFNGVKLLDGTIATAGSFIIQVGSNGDATLPGDNQVNIAAAFALLDTTSASLDLDGFDVSDAEKANELITKCDTALTKIAKQRSDIGAFQNRLDSKYETLATAIENYSSARSTILDADVAEESSNYIKYQILQQASSTLLATANQSPSIALSLV